MGKPCRYMQFIKPVFYYKSTKNQYQVLQVTHATPGLIITTVQSYTGKDITCLLLLAWLLMLHTRNNTDGNKLVIFFGITLYYGDTY